MLSFFSTFWNIWDMVLIAVLISLFVESIISVIFDFVSINFLFIKDKFFCFLYMPSDFLLNFRHCEFYIVKC